MPIDPEGNVQTQIFLRTVEDAKALLELATTQAYNHKIDARVANVMILAVNAFKGLLDVADVQKLYAELKAEMEAFRAQRGIHPE